MVVFAVDVEIGMDADEYLLEKDTEAYKQFHVRPAPWPPSRFQIKSSISPTQQGRRAAAPSQRHASPRLSTPRVALDQPLRATVLPPIPWLSLARDTSQARNTKPLTY